MQNLLAIALLTVGLLTLFQDSTSTRNTTQVDGIEREITRLKQELQKAPPAENQVALRDSLAKQQAEAAVTLFRLGQASLVWPLLRHSPDPSRRTYLIHRWGRMSADPSVIIRRLEVERDVSARRALILSLGEFTGEQLRSAQRQPLTAKLIRWYRNDPDPGIHFAIDWLMRHARQGQAARKLDWRGAEALAQIDRELAGRRAARRNWYVTREGQTMVVVRGPVEFLMGSPDHEPGRMADEVRHRVRIPRSFAVASKEVTVDQFRRFLEANPEIKRRHTYTEDPTRMARILERISPDGDGPQIAVTWYEAAQYCNWLSKQEGIPESEWSYPTDFNQIKDGMELPQDYLRRTGYRMLTEAEWEFSARAGATTSRFYGHSEELLEEYAWYSKNPPRRKSDPADPNDPQRTWPVGQLKPNDLGLFDTYGNVWEWGQDRWQEYRSDSAVHDDEEDIVLKVIDAQARTRRGGSFSYEAAVMRSAHRGAPNAYFPMQRRDNVGFRVARTYR
jgi:formylglycine-generating enzyme required for sulfatase activity